MGAQQDRLAGLWECVARARLGTYLYPNPCPRRRATRTPHARSALTSRQRRLVRTCERSEAGASLSLERGSGWICTAVGMLSARPGTLIGSWSRKLSFERLRKSIKFSALVRMIL